MAQRVAVVGWEGDSLTTDGYVVSFFEWQTPAASLNLKDYDVWVLLPDAIPKDLKSGTIWDALNVDYVHDALLHETIIYVLGDARRTVETTIHHRYFLDWLGLAIKWDSARSTVERYSAELASKYEVTDYMERRAQWDYALDAAQNFGGTMGGSFLTRGQTQYSKYDLDVLPLYKNRYGRSIAFAVQLSMYHSGERYSSGWEVSANYGSVVLLPANCDEVADYLNSFLTCAMKVSLRDEPPPWVESMVTPGQSDIDTQLSDLACKRAELEETLSGALSVRKELRKPLEVLYQTGSALEACVLAMLDELGAVIERPTETNREDGWLTAGGKEGVLEVKGTRKVQFDSYGPKQLLEWVNRGIQLRLKKYKPIFIGNSSPNLPPDERKSPFPKNWIEQARLGEIVAMSTPTLFEAYVMDKEERLDRDKFWAKLFSKSGVLTREDVASCLKSTGSGA